METSNDAKPVVTFYFDPISPYAWLASKDLDRLEADGVGVVCQPVLFAGLLNAHGQKGPAEIPAKRVYIFSDVVRIADRCGFPFQGPPTHPFNPLRALRMCIALEHLDERQKFAGALMQAAWEHGEDISDAEILNRIALDSGLAGRGLGAAAERPEVKAALLEATNAAIQKGIFGVPTFVLHDELFWGNDRFEMLLWRLRHPAQANPALDNFLQRGASAQR